MSRKASIIALLLLVGMAVALYGAAPNGVSPADQRTARVIALHELTLLHLLEFNSRQVGARDKGKLTRDLVERFKDLFDDESWQAKFLKTEDALEEADKQALAQIQNGQSEIWEAGKDGESAMCGACKERLSASNAIAW